MTGPTRIREDYDRRIANLQKTSKPSPGITTNPSVPVKRMSPALSTYDSELMAIEKKFAGQFAEIKQLRDDQLVILANNTT